MTATERKLLMDCRIALIDWTQTYASEFCSPNKVDESRERISVGGGTLAYVGELLQRCDEALSDSERNLPMRNKHG